MAKFKVNDYVLFMERPGVLSRGWVDKISVDKESCDVQFDDGRHGYRGMTIRCQYVIEVLPEKGRPLAYWKRELCSKCNYGWLQCPTAQIGDGVVEDCEWLTEMVVAGAFKKSDTKRG